MRWNDREKRQAESVSQRVIVLFCACVRERQIDAVSQKNRQTDRQTHRQTDRNGKHRQADGQTVWQNCREKIVFWKEKIETISSKQW